MFFLTLNVKPTYAATYDVPGEFGPMVGTEIVLNEKVYQNHQLGYVEKTNGNVTNVVTGRNIDGEGVITLINKQLLVDHVGQPFDLGSSYDQTKIVSEFREKYAQFYDLGIIVGIRCSGIKTWDGFIVQDFRYGDSNVTMWDRNINMAVLIYNNTLEEAFVLKDSFLVAWDGFKSIGSPVTDASSKSVTLVGETTETSFENIQIFENGYVYVQDGQAQVVTDVKFNSSTNSFYIPTGEELPSNINVPELPGEFGAIVGEYLKVEETIYINYERGYVKVTGVEGSYSFDHFAGKNVNSAGVEVYLDVNKMLEFVAHNIESNVGSTYGAGYNEEAFKQLYKNKYKELFESEYVVGISVSALKVWDGIIVQDFRYGDGSFSFGGGRVKMSILMYSKEAKNVFLLTDEFASAWDANKAIGSPIMDAGSKSVKLLNETTETAFDNIQIFENGYVYLQDGQTQIVKDVKYDAVTNSFYTPDPTELPSNINVIELPGEYGSQIGEYFKVSDAIYINYERGYVKVTGTEGNYEFYQVSGKNMSVTGVEVWVDIDKMLDFVAHIVESSVGTRIGAGFNEEALKLKFKDKYKELIESGYNVGICVSPLKVWDGFIVQDFRFGDGSFAFGGGRLRMTFLMYNIELDEVFALSDEFASSWDANKSLGTPIMDAGNKSVQLVGDTTETTFENIQIFENGYVYVQDGQTVVVKGQKYDATRNGFISTPIPNVNANYYGSKVEEIQVSDTVIYLNYQKGSIKAVLQEDGTYEYTFYNGRLYNEENDTVELLPLADLLLFVGEEVDGNYDNAEEIKQLIKAKYEELYNQGFFPGFKESPISSNWNGIIAQQFVYGDSSASPWGETRGYVTALVYVPSINKVVALKDNSLLKWDKNWSHYKDPISEEVVVDGNVYQQFESGLLVIIDNELYLSFMVNDKTYQEYIDSVPVWTGPTHEKDIEKGYIGDTYLVYEDRDNTLLIIGTVIVGLSVLGGGFVFLRRKKIL
jgi:hypothetical protein